MALDEALIRQLLADSRIEDFEDSLLFREEIRNRPGAAEILVKVMHEDAPDIADRAKGMLCLFDEPALGPLADALTMGGTQFRADVLDVVSTIIGVRDPREWPGLLGGILPRIATLLQDRELIDVPAQHRMEIQVVYRVCDVAYECVQVLQNPEFDIYQFLLMEFGERDAEIRALRARLGPLMA